jgi:hypothetical protein
MPVEPVEAVAPASPDPGPQEVTLSIPPELQAQVSQDILDGLGAEIGRLSGQLIVNAKQYDMERRVLIAQISQLQQQLLDAGVVPKSGGEPGDKTPPVKATAPSARKAAPRKRR